MGMAISPLPAHSMGWGEEKKPNQTPQRNKPKPKPKEDAPQCPGHNITIRDQAAARLLLLDWPSSVGQHQLCRDSHGSAALSFLALVTCSPFGTSTKGPRAQLGRNMGPTAGQGQEPAALVPALERNM